MRTDKLTFLFFALLILNIECESATIEVPNDDLPPPQSSFGTLLIESTPEATEVLIDNKPVYMATPFIVTLTAKNHLVVLKRKFYQDFLATVTILPDEQTKLTALLVSDFYPYTGQWGVEFPIAAPDPDDALWLELQLTVIDDVILGQDFVQFNDFSRGHGDCVGQIDATDHADILCSFRDDRDGYWRSVRYQLAPLSENKITFTTLILDPYHRIKLTNNLVRWP